MAFLFRSASRRQGFRKSLRLVCSCDRYNYGDLLFPIVTRRALTKINGWRDEHGWERYGCEQYGMARSNLRACGALPSRGMNDLNRDTEEGDVVLLAGGENLAQTWFVMHMSLLGPDAATRLAGLKDRLGPTLAERLSRWQFHGRQRFPYIIAPAQFHGRVRVMYNSMGGWPLRTMRTTPNSRLSAF